MQISFLAKRCANPNLFCVVVLRGTFPKQCIIDTLPERFDNYAEACDWSKHCNAVERDCKAGKEAKHGF